MIKILTPPPAPPLQGRGAATALTAAGTPQGTPLLGKEGLGVVDYAAAIDTMHAQPSSTTPNPSFLRRGIDYRACPDNLSFLRRGIDYRACPDNLSLNYINRY